MVKYRYTIITCNFGNYEIVREVKNPLQDVEYIYITDDPNLTSETWNVIYDETYNSYQFPFDKVIKFRSKCLEYCNSDICIRIDGSINICGVSFENTINEFNKCGSDISFILSPIMGNISTEIMGWLTINRISEEEANEFYNFVSNKHHSYDFCENSICTTGLVIQRNNTLNRRINQVQFDTLERIKEYNNVNHYYRIDQVVFTYVINEYFRDIKVLPLHYHHIFNENTFLCFHNTNSPRSEVKVTQCKDLYMFNKRVYSLYDGTKYISLLSKKDIIDKSKKIHISIPSEVYSDTLRYEMVQKSYNEWLKRDDIQIIDIHDEYYYYNSDVYEKYLTNTTYYKSVLPILCETLSIDYNENDFNVFNYYDLDTVLFPKYIEKYIYLIPRIKEENGKHTCYYNVCDSLVIGSSFDFFNKTHSNNKKEAFGEYSEYTDMSFKPFVVMRTDLNHEKDRNLLVFSDGSIIPFIPILMRYFSKIFVIDNYFSNYNFEFLYAYENITDILILSSTNKELDLIINNI